MGVAVPLGICLLLDLKTPAQLFGIAATTFLAWGAGDELEEHLLVRGAGQAAVRERNRVLVPTALAAAAPLALGLRRRQQRGTAAVEVLRRPLRHQAAGRVAAAARSRASVSAAAR